MPVTFGKIRCDDQTVHRSCGPSQSLKWMIWTKVGQTTGAGEGPISRPSCQRILSCVEQDQGLSSKPPRRVDHANDGRRGVRDRRHTVGSKPEHDGVTAWVIGHEDRRRVATGLVGNADIADARVAPIRTPGAGDGCQAHNPADFRGRKARGTSEPTERVAERCQIK